MNYYGIIAVILSLTITYHLKGKINDNLMVINVHHEKERNHAGSIIGLLKDAAKCSTDSNYDEPISLLDSFYHSQPFDWWLRWKISQKLKTENIVTDITKSNFNELSHWVFFIKSKSKFKNDHYVAPTPTMVLEIMEMIPDSAAILVTPFDDTGLESMENNYLYGSLKFYLGETEMDYEEFKFCKNEFRDIIVKFTHPVTGKEKLFKPNARL